MQRATTIALLVTTLLSLSLDTASAARAAELGHFDTLQRATAFLTFRDPSMRWALIGSMLLGICCGLMGAFLIVRRLALMGDALSHAVLPGIALGFLWNMTKDPAAIFIGAVLSGFLGAGVVQLIRSTTRHKEDAALGFVLASFFGAGICLLSMIQNLPQGGAKAGLDRFLFGQAAALARGDVLLLATVTLIVCGAMALFFKEYTLTSFDETFARAIGLPVPFFHYSLMLLLAFAIVASLQAVGVVLVSAMLVIPAATAFLLTHRFGLMLLLSGAIGLLAGAAGTFFSFIGRGLPTGPLMVLCAFALFSAALFFAPRQGILWRLWFERSKAARIRRENTLKAIYHILENDGFRREMVGIVELAARQREPIEETQRQLAAARRRGLLTAHGDAVCFTPEGWQRACEIVRNHRLWELYLTNAAHIAPDHVHEDAEVIEHVLGEETVLRLEKRLNYARRDPHGKLIPGIEDIRQGRATSRPTPAAGFGKNETP